MSAKRQRRAARRKAAGFSQEQLAERLGIDRSTVARWESGETEPQPWIRPRLARVLQVSLDQLDRLLAAGGLTQAGAAERMSHALSHPGSADLVTVADLRSQVHHLDEQYVHVASSSLLARAGQCLGQVCFLAAHASRGKVRRELYAVEAEAAILMPSSSGTRPSDATMPRPGCTWTRPSTPPARSATRPRKAWRCCARP